MLTHKKILGSLIWLLAATHAIAQEGVTPTEVRIGHSAPYSGPGAVYGTIGRAFSAYFDKVNKEGGIAGRKVVILSRDDAYSPPKAAEVTRQLVEKDGVLAVAAIVGAANNLAIRSYLNDRKIPHLFTATGSNEVAGDPAKYPYTVGWAPNTRTEGVLIGQHILRTVKDAKVAVLFQNDDFGKDLLQGLKAGLGNKADVLVAEKSYESTASTVNSEMISLKASGANVFVNFSSPRFAALAIRRAGEMQWKPVHYLEMSANSVAAVLKPAGLANAQDLITFQFFKDPSDPRWAKDEGVLAWLDFMDKYMPSVSKTDITAVIGYLQGETLRAALEKAGRDLTRESLLQAATSLKDVQLSMMLPGVKLNTSSMNRFPISCVRLASFKEEAWVPSGELLCDR